MVRDLGLIMSISAKLERAIETWVLWDLRRMFTAEVFHEDWHRFDEHDRLELGPIEWDHRRYEDECCE